MRRSISLLAVFVSAIAVLPAVSAVAEPSPDTATTTEGDDYATLERGNPWDYADAADVLLDVGGPGPMVAVTNARIAGGVLHVEHTGGGSISPLWGVIPGALSEVTDGPALPVDADHYTHLALHAFSSKRSLGQILWFNCNTWTEGNCQGRTGFILEEGWHTYVLPLVNDGISGTVAWSGDITGMRFDLRSDNQAATVEFDWLRLHAPGPSVTVSATDPGRLIWDTDTDKDNNTASQKGWGYVDEVGTVGGASASFPAGSFPPGTYNFTTDDAGVGYGSPLVIDARPLPVILDPDVLGGEDYAEAVLGNAWDMNGPEDAVEVGNADGSFGGGILTATNRTEDPYVRLPLSADIDTARYHRLTVKQTYDGPFDLGFGAGGGKHGRLIWWQRDSGDWQFHDSRELVTYKDRPVMTWEMLTDPPLEVEDPDGTNPAGRAGWAAANVHYLRWDPNEDPGNNTWRVDDVRLRADDETEGLFSIRWEDPNHAAGTKVTIRLDDDRSGGDGTVIASSIDQVAGVNTYVWDGRADIWSFAGKPWVSLTATDATQSTTRYASGPLRISPRVRGSGRIQTAIALSELGYATADAAIVAYDGNFPDALAAAPLADAAGGPVLLNSRDSLHPDVKTEIERLGAKTVYVLGGEGVQRPQVIADLEAIGGVTSVIRLSGTSSTGRFGTAVAIAHEAVDLWKADGRPEAGKRVVIALGDKFPDALAAGPLTIHGTMPMLLISKDSVPQVTQDAFAEFGTEEITVIGGTGAIPDSTKDAACPACAKRNRIGGTSRFDTAAKVAQAAVSEGADADVVLLATGDNFPDALGASPVVALQGGVLLLTSKGVLSQETAAYLSGRTASLSWLRVAGGPGAVTHATLRAILAAAGRG